MQVEQQFVVQLTHHTKYLMLLPSLKKTKKHKHTLHIYIDRKWESHIVQKHSPLHTSSICGYHINHTTLRKLVSHIFPAQITVYLKKKKKNTKKTTCQHMLQIHVAAI